MDTCFLVDFDGTICEVDIGNLLIREATGRSWGDFVSNMGSFEPETLPEKNYAIWTKVQMRKEAYDTFVEKHATPRPGFSEWLDKVVEMKAHIYVVSAGLDSYVRPCVEKWSKGKIKSENIVTVPCLDDPVEGHVRPDIPRVIKEKGHTGYGKNLVADRLRQVHANARMVAIGDGKSDVLLAENADLVFARRHLAAYRREHQLPFEPFETFFDILPLKGG